MQLKDRISAAKKLEDLFEQYSASLSVIAAYGSAHREVVDSFCNAMAATGNGSVQHLESARNSLKNVLSKNKFKTSEVFGGLHLLEKALGELADQFPDAGGLEVVRLSEAISNFAKSLDQMLFGSQRPDFILRTVRDAHTLNIQLHDLKVWSHLLAQILGDGDDDPDSRQLLITFEVTSTVENSVDVLREVHGIYEAVSQMLYGETQHPLLLKSAFTGSLTVVVSGGAIAIALIAKYLIQAIPEMAVLASEGSESRQIRSRVLLMKGILEMKDDLEQRGIRTDGLDEEISVAALELGKRTRKLAEQSDAVVVDGQRVTTGIGNKLLGPPSPD